MGTTELLDDAEMGERLTAWLLARPPANPLCGLPDQGIVTVRRLAEGHSNLTYVVTAGGRELILRRPPAGPLLPTAHDVVREYRVLDLLARSDVAVRAPRVLAVCEDDSVLGAPFYLMERALGVVIRHELPAWLGPSGQRTLGLDLAAALAEIHCVPVEPFVASGLGRAGGYLERQLRRWAGQREGIQTAVAVAGGQARELPDYDAVRDWLRDHLPTEQEPAVVHGDYKLDNVVVAKGPGLALDQHGAPDGSEAHVAAVVDWEMATVGDPRADLGYLLSFWPESGERFPLGDLVTGGPGFPTRAELVEVWEQGTGRPAGDTIWFVTLAVWKLAVLLEASYHRHLAGTTDDRFFATLEQGVPDLLAQAREVCGA